MPLNFLSNIICDNLKGGKLEGSAYIITKKHWRKHNAETHGDDALGLHQRLVHMNELSHVTDLHAGERFEEPNEVLGRVLEPRGESLGRVVLALPTGNSCNNL